MPERYFVRSSYSGPTGGQCVEACEPIGSEFRSSRNWSGGNGGNCVEINEGLNDQILLRDSKVPEVHIHVSPQAFEEFTEYAGAIALRDYSDVVA